MATGPIDYMGLMPQIDLGATLTRGLQTGAAFRAMQEKAQQARVERERQQAFQQSIGSIDPRDATAVSRVMMQFPEYSEKIKAGWDVGDEASNRANLLSLSDVYGKAASGDFAAAAKTARRRLEADKAAGLADEEDETFVANLESGDPARQKEALAQLGVQLAAVTGPDKFAATYGALTKGDEGYTLTPGSMRFDSAGNLVASAPTAPQYREVDGALIEIPGSGPIQAPGRYGATEESDALFARVIRQESGGQQFGSNGRPLTSPKGAIGIAQVMPKTGPEAAQLAGLPWNPAKFRNDAEYNMALGKAYFEKQLSDFGDPALATAAYNAGPGRVKIAIKKGGDNWINHVPEETQKYVANVVGKPQGGPRVLYQAPPKAAAARMTPEEVAAEGLDPNTVYYRNKEGIPQAVSGQSGKTFRQVPDSTAKRVTGNVEIRDSLQRALTGFEDDFGGNAVTGGLENQLQAVFGSGTPGQRQWWADFQSTDNQIRNDLFGSALTATEKAAYEATTISPRMSPKTIRENLTKRKAIIDKALNRQANFLKKNKYDPEAVDALFQADALGSQPRPPEGARQIGTSGGQPVYQLPNGQKIVWKP